jgi:predicted lysophospholipase L1 biosynthesis ABC-type transport system permease subunit
MTSRDQADAGSAELARVKGIAAFSGIATNDITVNGTDVLGLFVRADQGWVGPRIVRGRHPRAGEIALGAKTMSQAHVHIGDMVRVDTGKRVRVVGEAVLNSAGIESAMSPGEGAIVNWSSIPPDEAAEAAPQSFLIRFAPGADRAATTARINRLYPGSTSPALEPADVANLDDVAALPVALGVVMALLGLAAVAHALLTAVRRRRRELAVLRAVGLVGRQVRAAVAWQAITFAVLALAIGIPTGIALGRAAWSVAASQLAIVDRPEVPVSVMLASVLGFVLAVVAIAQVPARLAHRVPASVILRRE